MVLFRFLVLVQVSGPCSGSGHLLVPIPGPGPSSSPFPVPVPGPGLFLEGRSGFLLV